MGCLFSKRQNANTDPVQPANSAPPANPEPSSSTDQNKPTSPDPANPPQTSPTVEEDDVPTAPQEFLVDPLKLDRREEVGKGSSGNVRKAEDPETKKIVALKTFPIKLENSNTEEIMGKLKELYSSSHPNVACFHGAAYDKEKQKIMIAFEYFDRKSIKDVLYRSNTFPQDIMVKCCRDVLSALKYLHDDRRIIHRDIRPSNVLVNSGGVFKLADFGMSKELSDALTCNTWFGTYLYMSPERVQGSSYSFQADIWSWGIITFECLTGQNPYGKQKLDDIVDNPVPKLPDSFATDARDFVALCLVKDPKQRPTAAYLLANHPYLAPANKPKRSVRAWLKEIPV